jgi:hypothetical protein
MTEIDSRMELSMPASGCFRFWGTVKRRSVAGRPPIVVFTNFALIDVAIGSRQPIARELKSPVGPGGCLPWLSSRMIWPEPLLYSRTCRLQGLLWARAWSVLAPAAFRTIPLPTCALLHLDGTVGSLSRSVKAHFGMTFGFVTRPSAPSEYFSMTVARFDVSLSPTLKPRVSPVGIGFALLPLPLAVVEALCTVYVFAASATLTTAPRAASASTATKSFRIPPPPRG